MLYLRIKSPLYIAVLFWLMVTIGWLSPSPFAQAAEPILPGETVSGNLNAAGKVDEWTFTANAGDTVIARVGELSVTSDIRPRIRVTAPDGSQAATGQGFDDADVAFTAQASGAFTIKVDASLAAGRGTYRLTMGRIPSTPLVSAGDQGGAIAKGQLKNGNLYLGDMDFYTTSAESGDELVFRVGEVAPSPDIRPRLRVYGPAGTLLASGQGFDDAEVSLRATNTGPYIVVVDASSPGGSGDYRLSMSSSRGSVTLTPGDEGGEIANGELRRGMLPIGDLDVYVFSASAGDQLIVRTGETNTTPDLRPRLRLYGPTGSLLAADQGFDDAEVTAAAATTGVYTIVLSSSLAGGTGGYWINVAKSTGPATTVDGDDGGAIQDGELKQGFLTVGDLDLWTFQVTAGDRVLVKVGENQPVNDIRPRLRLFGADGALLASDQGFEDAEISVVATTSGPCLVVVSSSFVNGAGSYRLSMTRSVGDVLVSAGDEGGVIQNGETKLGQLAPGDLDVFTFDAAQGERFVVRLAEYQLTNDLRPRLRIFGPLGTLYGDVADFTDVEFLGKATNAGPYKVVVSATFEAGIGSYHLTLAKSGGELAISNGDDGGPLASGLLQPGQLSVGDVDIWVFDAEAGDSLVARVAESELINDIRPRLRLVSPTGDLLANEQQFDDLEVTAKATVSGRYYLWVSGAQPGAAGGYLVNYVRIPGNQSVAAGDQGGTIRNGETKNGELKPGDLDAWTFSALPQQTILIRVGELLPVNDIRPRVRLFGPTGALMAEEQSFEGLEILTRATNAGLHTIVVSGAFLGAAGTYQIHLFQNPGSLFTSENDEGGLVLGASAKTGTIRAADLDPWAFTSCLGDVISITATQTSPNGRLLPWLRLFGRDGSVLASKSGGNTVTLTAKAPSDGTYVLVISDASSSTAGAGDYELQFGGLSAGIKLCRPNVSGGLLTLTAAGAEPGQSYILTTSQDLTLPSTLWEPITTNVFGSFGEMLYQGPYRPEISAQYFKLRIP